MTDRNLTLGVIAALLLTVGPVGRATAQEADDEHAVDAGQSANEEGAADDEQARAHFVAATSYFTQANYEQAVVEFLESYRLSQRTVLLVNVARCYERLGDWSRAVEYLERFFEETSGDPPIEGEATLRARLENYREHAARSEGPSALTIASIISFAVAAAGAGIFIGTGVAAHDRFEALQQSCPDGRCGDELRPTRDEGALLADVSTAFTFVSAAALAAGVVLLAIDLAGSSGDEMAATSVVRLAGAPLLGPSERGGVVGLYARF